MSTPATPAPSRPSVSSLPILDPAKTKHRERVTIVLDEADLVETFVKGSGPGGQCVNKRSNCVNLTHTPTGIRIRCQHTRSLSLNRATARKLLRAKLDDLYNGNLSHSSTKAAKLAKQKAKRAQRAREKYGTADATGSPGGEAADQERRHVKVSGEEEDRLVEEEMYEEVGVVEREEGREGEREETDLGDEEGWQKKSKKRAVKP
ncbi:RF-1 domain-containing protein [Jimgerdemannia flammicorona]|nr:RF-1 domain-containing protein [Jimgerdemannia flammicorona]